MHTANLISAKAFPTGYRWVFPCIIISFITDIQSLDDSQGLKSGSKCPDLKVLTISLRLSSQILFLRKIHGSRLNVFAPVNDLSALSKTGSEHLSLIPGKNNEVAIAGGQILGDEYTEHVIKVFVRPFVSLFSRLALTQIHRTDEASFCEKGLFLFTLAVCDDQSCASARCSSPINGSVRLSRSRMISEERSISAMYRIR
jgi:hypothetical protein